MLVGVELLVELNDVCCQVDPVLVRALAVVDVVFRGSSDECCHLLVVAAGCEEEVKQVLLRSLP